LSNVTWNSSYQITGAYLSSAPVESGATVTHITTDTAWQMAELTGARVFYSDKYVYNAGLAGRASLNVVDLSTSAPPTLIQTEADAYTAVSADGTKLVYSIDTSATANGLYVYDIP
jgi:hypothetical protein